MSERRRAHPGRESGLALVVQVRHCCRPMLRRRRLQAAAAAVVDDDDDDGVMAYALSRHRARLASAIDLPETLSEYIEEVLQWYY